MISHASFQEQVIDELQAHAGLIAIVPIDQIKEAQYQATEFTYPAVRVDVRTQPPEGNGPCRPRISIENFAVIAYSEEDSSLQCEQICFQISRRRDAILAPRALFGAQLEDAAPIEGPNWRTETVNLVTVNAPRRLTEKIWRGEVIFRCRVKETS